MYVSLVSQHLEYAVQTWNHKLGTLQEDICWMERVQKRLQESQLDLRNLIMKND